MNTRLVIKDGKSYLEVLPGEGQLESERDALDLVAACGENETDRLLIDAGGLAPDFYQLKTGLAGAVLLKFSNYAIRAAVVIPADQIGTGHFYEMVLETNRGSDFRVYSTQAEAEGWLISG